MKTLDSVPVLPEDVAADLQEPRPAALVITLAWTAAVAALVIAVVAGSPPWMEEVWRRDRGPARWALDLAGSLLPWLLSLGIMRPLDIRPVRWFFLSLIHPLFTAGLAFLMTKRLLSLPYRDWTIEYWNVPYVRRLPWRRDYVLVGRTPLWRNPRANRWEVVSDPILMVLWPVLMAAAAVAYIWRDSLPGWFMQATLVGIVVTAVVPALIDVAMAFRRGLREDDPRPTPGP